MQKITSKNTKNEILEAYEQVLTRLEETKKTNSEMHKIKKEDEVLSQISKNSKSDVILKFADFKIEINNYLEKLEEKLINEKNKLETLLSAKNIEDKKLKDLYEINAKASTLEALIIAEHENKNKFEEESKKRKNEVEVYITEKKIEWEKEQKEYQILKKEKEERLKKEYERKNEEYEYELKLKTQKDNDLYNHKKAELEYQLAERKKLVEDQLQTREKKIKEIENEYQELKKFKEEAEKNTEIRITKIEKDLTKELQSKFDFELKFKSKEAESNSNLLNQRIKLLEEQLKEKQTIIDQVTERLDKAQAQAQDLAKRIVEGSSVSAMKEFSYLKDNKIKDHNLDNLN
ncbi:MAG: hypothetical protein GY830_06960 [Bacteroidetes bacterium]|nr:hypothetical protein [Bacteroidota bacterium]